MDLKTEDLRSFLEVQKHGSFTKAAAALGMTQPALSLKIARLEELLQTPLFIRHPRFLELTSSGERLLSFARETISHQENFLASFDQFQSELAGVIRIGAFSSVMRSIIIPRTAVIWSESEKVSIEYQSAEMYELEERLRTNRVDFIVTDYYPDLPTCEQLQIGEEEYVIIESKKHKNIPNIFLDHTPLDNATDSYFKAQGLKQEYRRGYMGEVYSIIDGVALGLGRAVMSRHLIEGDSRFRIVKGKKKYSRPIVLSYLKQNYYGPLHLRVLEALRDNC